MKSGSPFTLSNPNNVIDPNPYDNILNTIINSCVCKENELHTLTASLAKVKSTNENTTEF